MTLAFKPNAIPQEPLQRQRAASSLCSGALLLDSAEAALFFIFFWTYWDCCVISPFNIEFHHCNKLYITSIFPFTISSFTLVHHHFNSAPLPVTSLPSVSISHLPFWGSLSIQLFTMELPNSFFQTFSFLHFLKFLSVLMSSSQTQRLSPGISRVFFCKGLDRRYFSCCGSCGLSQLLNSRKPGIGFHLCVDCLTFDKLCVVLLVSVITAWAGACPAQSSQARDWDRHRQPFLLPSTSVSNGVSVLEVMELVISLPFQLCKVTRCLYIWMFPNSDLAARHSRIH